MTNTIDNTSLSLFTDESQYTISSIISPRVQVAYMNNAESSPLHDIELRKAISYGVDRDAYADLIGGSAAHSFYSDATPFGNDTLDAYTYDADKAVEILDNAGYVDVDGDGYRETPEGETLTLRFVQAADHGSSDSAILAQAVQSNLKDIGINVEIQSVENLSDIQASGEFDFYTANDNSAPTGDPQVWLETMYTGLGTSGKKNLTSYQNDQIDAIVEQMKTTFDTQERYALAKEASQIVIDDAANLFLTNVSLNMVSSSKLANAVQPVCDYYFITQDLTLAE
jgi:peptide/nickel transport system substrate-binding protein